MDLDLRAFIGFAYFFPIAMTLRKVYAPQFDTPDTFLRVLGKLDKSKMDPCVLSYFTVPEAPVAALK